MDSLVGGMLGRYRIEGWLGRGGMSTVYRALDPVFGRSVAVKVLTAQLAHDPQYTSRFQREARSMARLQHPHILPVYDVGDQNGTVFLVMQYIEGGNLHEYLAEQRRIGELYTERALGILEAVAGALDFAHGQGIVHRDVKPQNILLTPRGYPYLTDFGIAKILDQENADTSFSLANAIIGTPEYMSPEQAQGQPLDGRADLYSLGVILYELFTGRTPFRAETTSDTPLTILIRHAGTPPPPPRHLNPSLGEAVEAVLLRALAKRPDERYASGAALFGALHEALAVPGQSPTVFALPTTFSGRTPIPALPNLTPLPVEPSHSQTSLPLVPSESGVVSGGPIAIPAAAPPPAPARSRRGLALALSSVAVLLALLGVVIARSILGAGAGGDATATTVAVEPSPAGTAVIAALPVTPSALVPSPTVPSGGTAPLATAVRPVVATPSVAGNVAATPGSAGRREVILFSSHRNDVHDSQIYIMNPDGSGQRQLTFTRGHSWGPRVSPDGKFFVFSSVSPGEHVDHTATGGGRKGEGHHEVFRADVTGADIVRLTNTNAWNNVWAWSPDSQSMILASDRDGEWELYRMSVNGEQEKIARLTTNPALDGWPSFTPDGKQIVFASDREGGTSQIYVMNADGTGVRRLTNSKSYDTLPNVSPDGRKITYAVQTGTDQTGITSDIYVMNIDGSNPTRLTRDSIAVNTDPSWSPDGTRIIFSSDREGNSNIYVINVDGSGTKRLTTDPGEDITPFWAIIQTEASGPTGETSGRVDETSEPIGWAGETVAFAGTASPLVGFLRHWPTGPLAHYAHSFTLPTWRSVRLSYRKRRRL